METSILKNKILFFQPSKVPKKQSKNISKIVDIDFFLLNELENTKKIQRIDGYENHFYTFYNAQTTQINVLENQDSDDDFAIDNPFQTNKKLQNSAEDMLLQFEDRELIYFDGYLKSLSCTKKYLRKLIEFYIHLLSSLKLLDKIQLYHGNIDFKNILVDSKENVLLCNFSHSLNLTRHDISHHLIYFLIDKNDTRHKPLEWYFLKHLSLHTNVALSSYNIEKIIDTYLERNEVLRHFGNNVLSTLKLDASAFFLNFVNKTYNETSLELLQFANTWNLFELSMAYLKILLGIQRTIQKTNRFITHFAKLLVENVSTDPRKRHNVLKTINFFDSILQDIEMKDYKEIVEFL
jgi:hypothetical protein